MRSARRLRFLILPALVLAPASFAQTSSTVAIPNFNFEPGNTARWTGTGELGFAAARGNSTSENANAKLRVAYEDRDWRHEFNLTGLRASSEVNIGTDEEPERVRETTANRYQVGASSAIKYNEVSYWKSSLRHEHDDFAAYRWQSTFAVAYGRVLMRDDAGRFLALEAGPGYRRARDVEEEETENGPIARGYVDFRYPLTDNTSLINTLLVESGQDNTFAQNDLGLQVTMTERMALKAGFQARHNTDVQDGRENTDRLTTVNLVYDFE
ncbi:DUF481 domain-containing protein [Coralloluteibacterium stylophorae]|uniref:DUF481 domain-containing protein n=1 Tax=Coralloluteibacterium stylophorae TaxID=1776034 RepID=A0A8J8AX33_9GAMM|nr:DUF481 domain-containing protein [Coralloluteibacterium stylophorae]MBS7458826.1 DUF481 domain-containing protein [Coralloluteibacterium stylophorae]